MYAPQIGRKLGNTTPSIRSVLDMKKTGNEIVDISLEFALQIIEFTEILEEKRKI